MDISNKDKQILLDLADRLNEEYHSEENQNKIKLWTDCNDLKRTRPAVFVDAQNGWGEFHNVFVNPFMQCESERARNLEFSMRLRLARKEHIHDDYPVNNYFVLGIGIKKTDWGINQKMSHPQKNGSLTAYHIEPTIQSMDDVKKLRPAEFSFDESAFDYANSVKAEYEEFFEDRVNVMLRGLVNWRCGLTRQLIHMRGLDNMMYDLYDNPDLIHALMSFLRDEQMRELDFWEENKLISPSNTLDNISGTGAPILNGTMMKEDNMSRTATLKDFAGWGESQEFVGVGPEHFKEFVYDYQVPILKRFGRVDFGCCEPLDNKYDVIFSELNNIRGVAVPPWANFELAAERLTDKYVYVFKQNPAYVCCENPDFDIVEQDLRKVVKIALKKNCPMHIVLKDTNSFYGHPERLTKWSDIAVKVVKEEYGKEN